MKPLATNSQLQQNPNRSCVRVNHTDRSLAGVARARIADRDIFIILASDYARLKSKILISRHTSHATR